MKPVNLFAPYFVDQHRRVQRVKCIQTRIGAKWSEYSRYCFVSGVGTKLHQIPRYTCGSENSSIEHLLRSQRLIGFMDATGCRPINSYECPKTHTTIPLLNNPDHMTWWFGPNGEQLILIEPYTSRDEILAEIASRQLTALVLLHPGIYGGASGRSTSVFITLPQHAEYLKQLAGIQLNAPTGEIQDINWYQALNLGRGSKS